MRARHRDRITGIASVAVAFTASFAHAVEWRIQSESVDGLRLQIEVQIEAPLRIDADIDGRRFSRFDIPDTRPVGSQGAPELAEAASWIALPPGGSASLRVLDSDIREMGQVLVMPRAMQSVRYGEDASPEDPSSGMPFEELVYEPSRYAADGPVQQPAQLGEVAQVRHQRMVPLLVSPLLYDPSTQRLRVVRRLLVEVTIRAAARAPGQGGGAALARLATPRSWERIYAATLLNPQTAERWRFTPPRRERLRTPLKSGLLPPGLLAEDEWKLRARRTGAMRVRGTTLLGAGFPDGTPIDRLRLVIKRFNPAAPLDPTIMEIPILVEDNDSDGMFRSADAFVFVAEHPRDDSTAGERAARYSFDNVYWLSVADTGTPARIAVRAPLVGATPGPPSFQQEIVVEEDNAANEWVYCDEGELYFTIDLMPTPGRPGSATEGTKTVATPGRRADSDLEVCVETQQDWLQRPYRLHAEFAGGPRIPLAFNPGVNANVPRGTCPTRRTTCGTVPAAQALPGDVTVVVTREPGPHSFTDRTPYVDVIRLRYRSDYTAVADRAEFTSGGMVGASAFTVTGFSGAALLAMDVTDRKAPAVFDMAGALVGGTLTLTDDVPLDVTRRYVVQGQMTVPELAPENIELDPPDPILDELDMLGLGSYDVLVVAHDDFASDAALLEWQAFRVSQGHRVRIISTSNVYDAFNGGLPHYDPIYNFVRSAYENWGISYVMLVGDGSEDQAGLFPASGPNFVPGKMVYFPVVASGGGGGNEYRNDIHERYYARMDPDPWPDLLVGRLPVSNAQELRNVVDKILLYEQPAEDDDGNWRKRVVMFSDDEWVIRARSDGGPGFSHVRGNTCAEWNFFRSIDRACDTVNEAFPGDMKCVPFYLHTFSDSMATLTNPITAHNPWSPDSLPGNCRSSVYVAEHSMNFTEIGFYANVAEALADSVGEGALFLALQAHANFRTVCDEGIIRQQSPFNPRYDNDGKPFVFFGLGCHLNEFGRFEEDAVPFGDAIGELYVTIADEAAVASYASTGFEFLSENNRFHENMWRTIFNKRYFRGLGDAVVDSDTLESNWKLSALTQISEISHRNRDIVARYALLGDPLLQLDAGVPRFVVADTTNGTIFEDGRIRPDDPSMPMGFEISIKDEQGIDSLWVEKRFADGAIVPVQGVVITADSIDAAPQIRAKRSYTVAFSVMFEECNFDLHVGARDLAGRVSEWIGKATFANGTDFEQRLLANGILVDQGQSVDAATAFRYEYEGCGPRLALALSVFLNDQPVEISEPESDEAGVVWFTDFVWDVGPGRHMLRFDLDGQPILSMELVVPGQLGLSDVLAFPNPFEGETRIFFNLQSQISGGVLRIMDLNGRTVRSFNLSDPGVVQVLSSSAPPTGAIGSSQWMNYVEWDGRDRVGDQVANGVYLFELRIEDQNGQAMRTRDKLVVMN